jgi:malate synthase
MPQPNQISRQREDVHVTAAELLQPPQGTITEDGLGSNIRVGIQYLEAWLGGNGCVPLYNLMEDAATAEISRAQIWQWLKHNAALADGRKITPQLYDELLPQEMARIEKEVGSARFNSGNYARAAKLFSEMSRSAQFAEFLTLPAYELLD